MSSRFSPNTLHYENFDLRIHDAVDGLYAIEVISSPVGEMKSPILKPFRHLRNIHLLIDLASLGRTDLRLSKAERLGDFLAEMLFPDQVWNMFYASLTKQISRGQGLRIRLRVDPLVLCRLPWEYCYREPFAYLALGRETPLVRYTNQPLPADTLTVSHSPLRLLVVIAAPFDLAPLDVEAEKMRITEALQGQEERIQVQFLDHATVSRVQNTLIEYQPHVLHFIGHGIDAKKGGQIALENDVGKAHFVDADQLMILLRGRGLKLVVLNACKSATYGQDDIAMTSVGQALVQANIPAVIAMQFPIPDSTAILVARQLYTSLALGQPIDTAITEVRIAAYNEGNDKVHWGVPVLFMRSDSGVIIQPPKEEASEKEAPKAKNSSSSALNISDISGSSISINIGGDVAGGNIDK